MATHDYEIANQTPANFRADLNNALQAIVTQNSGSSAPTTTFSNMLWYDTANNILKMRPEANAGSTWINVGYVDQSSNAWRVLDNTQVVDTSGTQTGLLGDQSTATWETGTGTTESLVSPAKVRAAIEAAHTLDIGAENSEGYTILPSGLIFQWGTTGDISGTVSVTMPITFPNAQTGGVASIAHSGTYDGNVAAYYEPTGLSTADITHDATITGSSNNVTWFCWGY